MSDSSKPLGLKTLNELVRSDAVAIRGHATLEPAGGPSDKIFPPTHSVDTKKPSPGAKYALEKRRINNEDVDCVLLDSVQSQANRMEEALQALWADKLIALPVIEVDFSDCAPGLRVTSLSAPHRIADALLRDSVTGDGELFRMSALGTSFTDATLTNAGPLFKVCPTGLVFGMWDSTGPKGGLGSKFARALTSEIVGVSVVLGVKTASRIDPTGIVTSAGPIFVAKELGPDGLPTWTHEVMKAKPIDETNPPSGPNDVDAVRKWGKKEKAGKPTAINHSNIPPTIDTVAGGVTIDHATHTVVLSLAALRKLHFGGNEGDAEARTVLTALALLALFANESRGHDLRSRCLLVPQEGKALALEVVRRDGSTEPIELSLDDARSLYTQAVAQLPESLKFSAKPGEPLATLKPSPKLAHLVKRSRELAATGAEVGEE